jgi:dihydrofolate reductase
MSLDGYIADRGGGTDFLTQDPTYDGRTFMDAVDTAVMGRGTFEAALRYGSGGMPGLKTYVCSRTLRQEDFPGVAVSGDAEGTVAALRAEDGKDIWLVGGGLLFRSLAEAGLVDTVEVGVSPVLLGEGIPFLPPTPRSVRLALTQCQQYPSGMVILLYNVRREMD